MASASAPVLSRDDLIRAAWQIAQEVGIDPGIFVSQIDQESGFNPKAKNPSGATGIAQLMPEYYQNAGADPIADLRSAAQTDAANLKRFNGDYSLMLAAYDAGAGAVEQAGGVPDYPETHRYVQSILQAANNPQNPIFGPMQDPGGNTAGAGTSTPLSPDEIAQLLPDFETPPATQTTTGGTPEDIPPGGYAPQDWQSIVARNGGIASEGPSKRIQVPDPNFKGLPGEQAPKIWQADPNSPTIIAFNNGTTVLAKYAGTAENPTTPVQVVPTPGQKAQPQPKTWQRPDGSLWEEDPKTGQWAQKVAPLDPTDTKTPRTVQLADGTVVQYNWDTKTWDPIGGPRAQTATPVLQKFPDGSERQWNPTTKSWDILQGPNPYDTQEQQLRIAQAQRALMPQQQKIFQDAYDTIDTIKQKLSQGLITPQEANGLVSEIHKGIQASLAGTTLFDEYKQQQDEQQKQAAEASALLRERVSSGTSLAHSLLATAAGHVLMPAGQTTLGIDPYAIAKAQVNDLGGGADVAAKAADVLRSFFGGQGSASPLNFTGSPLGGSPLGQSQGGSDTSTGLAVPKVPTVQDQMGQRQQMMSALAQALLQKVNPDAAGIGV